MRTKLGMAALLLFSTTALPAAAHYDQPPAEAEPVTHRHLERVDPCTDGRFSDGRARSCGELLDWLDGRDERWHRGDRYRHGEPIYDPCHDGRVSDGRPRTCRELRRPLQREGRR